MLNQASKIAAINQECIATHVRKQQTDTKVIATATATAQKMIEPHLLAAIKLLQKLEARQEWDAHQCSSHDSQNQALLEVVLLQQVVDLDLQLVIESPVIDQLDRCH